MAMGAPGGESPLDTELYLVDAAADGIEVPARFDGLGLRGNASRAAARARAASRRTGGWARRIGLCADDAGDAAVVRARLGGVLRRDRGRRDRARRSSTPTGARLRASRARRSPTCPACASGSRGPRSATWRRARCCARSPGRSPTGTPDAQLGVLAVKASAAEMAAEVCDLCMRVGGGAAYSRHGPLERHLRDARAAAVMAPTTELLHDFIGKALTGQELF